MNNLMIANQNLKVNAFKDIFTNTFKSNTFFNLNDKQDDFVEIETQDNFFTNDDILTVSNEIDKQDEQNILFYSLVPKIHQSTVKNLVKTQFKNNLDEYKKTIPTFFDPLIWNKKSKDDTDEKFITNKSNRNKKAYKKGLILHSAQLLKLIGFGRQKVATKGMVKEYVEDMENSDDYIANLRLINSSGKIIKLETNKEKQYKKLARMNKIADTMDLIAKDKSFTNSMITLTLPPVFHPNPKNKNCSYGGQTPGQAKEQLMNYWKSLRATLSNNGFIFGDNLIGLQVIELQQDSTLHLHSIFYHSKEDQQLLTDCLHSVEDNYNDKQIEERFKLGRWIKDELGNTIRKRGFDISYSNQKVGEQDYQRGSSYLMKYLYKTHTTYDDKNPDDSVLKNQTSRWFYGIRSFNFFGFNGVITKFEFLVKNWKSYEQALTTEIINCLKIGDLYSFIKNYKDFFTNEYNKDQSKRTFLGVIFHRALYKKSVNLEKQNILVLELIEKLNNEINKMKAKLDKFIIEQNLEQITRLNNAINKKIEKLSSLSNTDKAVQDKIDKVLSSYKLVLIEKKIFSIFQANESNQELKAITGIDLDTLLNVNIKSSYENVLDKQDEFDFKIDFVNEHYIDQGIKLLTLFTLNTIGLQLFKAIQGKVLNDTQTEIKQDIERILEKYILKTV